MKPSHMLFTTLVLVSGIAATLFARQEYVSAILLIALLLVVACLQVYLHVRQSRQAASDEVIRSASRLGWVSYAAGGMLLIALALRLAFQHELAWIVLIFAIILLGVNLLVSYLARSLLAHDVRRVRSRATPKDSIRDIGDAEKIRILEQGIKVLAENAQQADAASQRHSVIAKYAPFILAALILAIGVSVFFLPTELSIGAFSGIVAIIGGLMLLERGIRLLVGKTVTTPAQQPGAAELFAAAAAHPTASGGSPRPTWTPPAPSELAPLFPDLEIQALIGQGGMGAVYRVREKNGDRQAALKILRPEESGGPDFAERFAREAQALKRLNHPNIVTIYDSGRSGTWCWLLMELVDGANLRQVLATGALSPAQTLALVPPLCMALQFAHDAGIVHRDIKPENIILDANGQPKIADFGLAKLQTGVGSGSLTGTGAVLGTIHYMAPEQVENSKDVDHRADIYGLGVVIYELLTGGLPLGRFEPPSHRAGVDARMDDVVFKALERDPARRWQQASDVQLAVEQVSSATKPFSPYISTIDEDEGPGVSVRVAVIALGIGVVGACVNLSVIHVPSVAETLAIVLGWPTGVFFISLAWASYPRARKWMVMSIAIWVCLMYVVFASWTKADRRLEEAMKKESLTWQTAARSGRFEKNVLVGGDESWLYIDSERQIVIGGVHRIRWGGIENGLAHITSPLRSAAEVDIVDGAITSMDFRVADRTVTRVSVGYVSGVKLPGLKLPIVETAIIGEQFNNIVAWAHRQIEQRGSLDLRLMQTPKLEFSSQ